MSEQYNKQNNELSMDDLDAVAGGAANVVNSSRSNVRNNMSVTDPTSGTPTATSTPTAAPPQSLPPTSTLTTP